MIDLVSHPPHYKTESGIEAIDVIEQYGLGYHLGNAMKYLLRAGRKDPAREREDLEKARWYLKRWLDGIDMKRGVDLPFASDSDCGGVCWQTPETIAEAFGLTGARHAAVVEILSAGCFGDDEPRVLVALRALEEALA